MQKSMLGKGLPMVTTCACSWEDRWDDWGPGYRAAAEMRAERHARERHPEMTGATRTTEECEVGLMNADLQEALRKIYDNGARLRFAPAMSPLDPSLEYVSVGLCDKPTDPNCAISPFSRYRHLDGRVTEFGVTCAVYGCHCSRDVAGAASA